MTWTRIPPTKPGRCLFAVAALAVLLVVEGLPDADADDKKPGRAPTGWKIIDTTAGALGWAKKVEDPRTGIVFVLIAPGEFKMGSESRGASDNEKPAHKVRITKPFYLAESETTLRQWHTFVRAAKPKERPGMTVLGPPSSHPLTCRNWNDAKAFCRHYGYRLPTEAEWEYACRAGTKQDRYGKLDEIAWHLGNNRFWHPGAAPTMKKKPNTWGLYDMVGNVREWCEDGFDPKFYARSPRTDPCCGGRLRRGQPAPLDPPGRVSRGGSFLWDSRWVRASTRWVEAASEASDDVGFRAAKTLPK